MREQDHIERRGGRSGKAPGGASAIGTGGPAAADRADWLVLGTLLAVTALAWCASHALWGPREWSLPTSYLEPVYADFLGTAAYVKAMTEGGVVPFGWKSSAGLGAPGQASWSGLPTPDEVLFAFIGLLAKVCGLFAGLNLGVLVAHLAAVACFYAVARTFGCVNPWAAVASLAFGLAPYLFAQSPHHVTCAYVWHVPLFLLVWTWMAEEPGMAVGSRRFWTAVGIGFVAGLQNPYFTFILCQLTLLAAAVAAWRRRSRAALVPAGAVVGAAALAFLVSNLDTLTYRMAHVAGGAPMVGQREYRWMDIYGLKLVDLVMPWITHHSDAFAKFGLAHRQASVLNDEEGCAYLGLLGVACLALLVVRTARALLDGRLDAVPPAAWWVLWIVLYFVTGGLNSVIAAFTGFTLFRTAVRYSVVILAIVLMEAARRVSAWQREAAGTVAPDILRIGTGTAAVALAAVVLWDQVPRTPTAEQAGAIARAVQSDRELVGKLEAALPDGAMVFQLPVSDGTPQNGLSSSDHYRPYLFSRKLRWSHGASPGSQILQWQQAVQQQLVDGAVADQQSQQIRFKVDNVGRAVAELRGKGFAAIYVNRNGFPDKGKGLFDALLELGCEKPPIFSAAGDLAVVLLDAPAGK